MCYITDATLRARIFEATVALTGAGRVFTGHDVFMGLCLERTDESPRAWQISSYVRELYNSRSPLFNGYASYPIPGGPLMYFPIGETSEEVNNNVRQIMASLAEKSEAKVQASEEEAQGEEGEQPAIRAGTAEARTTAI